VKKNRYIKVKIFFIVFTFCFILTEIILRIAGYKQGLLSPDWANFKIVDSLEVIPSFYANEKGLFVANPEFFKNKYDINKDGFRGMDFERDTSKPSILFLGDSYTWGSHADPIEECFVEKVERAGFAVYNTGIPGADPPQYYAIAKEYIPKLKPTYVCLMFYAGNDFIEKDRAIEPYKNVFHVTNAGWLSPYINDTYIPYPLEVYKYYVSKYKVGKEAPLWKRILSKTVIGTLFLSIPRRLEEKKAWQIDKDISIKYINNIDSLCKENNSRFLLFVIPLHTEISDKMYLNYTSIFRGIEVNIPENIHRSDFLPWPNGHLNNEGHEKYAEKILRKIILDKSGKN